MHQPATNTATSLLEPEIMTINRRNTALCAHACIGIRNPAIVFTWIDAAAADQQRISIPLSCKKSKRILTPVATRVACTYNAQSSLTWRHPGAEEGTGSECPGPKFVLGELARGPGAARHIAHSQRHGSRHLCQRV